MTIPLDNLYHYIDALFPEPVCMYLFYPHGSRNILDIVGLKKFNRALVSSTALDGAIYPSVICNDQEPLNYKLYQDLPKEVVDTLKNKFKKIRDTNSNLKLVLPNGMYDKVILVHSEKNSPDVEQYKKENYIDVYYWSHAIIARDWYRFAEYDKRLMASCYPATDFLIYCRDWSGSREYRIKFQELLYDNDLVKNSVTNIKQVNSQGTRLEDFVFDNLKFAPNNNDFFYKLSENCVDSVASADYCPDDFNNTKISVVLETVFDNAKIHLTEKILRPIACGHPFVLAAGPESLNYLRNYGFKTFSPWLDEDYDLEPDSVKRLEKIIKSLKRFSSLPESNKKIVYEEIKKIAEYNQQWFFSKEFSTLIQQELITNINAAMNLIKQTRSLDFRSRTKHYFVKDKQLERKIIADRLRELRRFNRSLK